jgi:hypothetical protein
MCLSPRRRPVAPALTWEAPGHHGQGFSVSRIPGTTARGNVVLAADNSKMRGAQARLKGGTGVQTVAAARARVSQRRRTVSSAALSTVNVIAVIQAEPASGSAAPSTITAT